MMCHKGRGFFLYLLLQPLRRLGLGRLGMVQWRGVVGSRPFNDWEFKEEENFLVKLQWKSLNYLEDRVVCAGLKMEG